MMTTTISFCVTNFLSPSLPSAIPRGTGGTLFLYMSNNFPPVPLQHQNNENMYNSTSLQKFTSHVKSPRIKIKQMP